MIKRVRYFSIIAILLLPNMVRGQLKDDFTQSIRIEYDSTRPHDIWKAKAMEHAHRRFISGYNDLKILTPRTDEKADYLLSGRVTDDVLSYTLKSTDKEIVFNQGSIELTQDFGRQQIAALKAINVLIKNGGLIDQARAKYELEKSLNDGKQDSMISVRPELETPIFLVGGLLWGLILVVLLSFVLGTLHGIERIWHWNIITFLRSYIELTATKAAFFFIVASPILAISFYAKHALIIEPKIFYTTFLPTLLLLSFLVFSLVNRIFIQKLDSKYLSLNLKNSQKWDQKIRHYFMGYYKRLGLNIPMAVLDNILFAPTGAPEAVTYGGLFTQARVLIPRHLLELALGQPNFVAVDDEEKVPMDSNEPHGRILPSKIQPSKISIKSEKKVEKILKKSPFNLTTFKKLEESQEATSVPMEMSAGVWGQIRPSGDSSVGLVSNNLQDLQIVKELLQEHHIYFAKLQFDEEYDDTDPDSLDFMFGLLLREVGKVHRREPLLFTFLLFIETKTSLLKGKLKTLKETISETYQRGFSKHYAVVADGYVCLNHGRHHLLQYLYFQKTGSFDLTTKRSSCDNLFATSEAIYHEFDSMEPEEKDLDRYRTTLLNRINWLAHFFAFDSKPVEYRKTSPILPITVAASILIIIALEVVATMQFFEVFKNRYYEFQNKLTEYEEEQGARNGS